MTLRVASLACSIVAGSAAGLGATEQCSDRVVYKGVTYDIRREYPLERYFAEYPNRRPRTEVRSTALHRGYRATFEIRDLRLIVRDVEVRDLGDIDAVPHATEWKSVVSTVWPHKRPLHADWFTGTLVLPYGKRHVESEWYPQGLYRTFMLLDIRRGRLTTVRRVDLKPLIRAYRQTDAGRREVARLLRRAPDYSDDAIGLFLRLDTLRWAKKLRDPAVIRRTDGIRRVRVIRDL